MNESEKEGFIPLNRLPEKMRSLLNTNTMKTRVKHISQPKDQFEWVVNNALENLENQGHELLYMQYAFGDTQPSCLITYKVNPYANTLGDTPLPANP